MSDQENFISRWSRRKRDTANENAQPDKPAEPGPDATPAVAGTTPAAASAPEFDLTKLPSLESIGANTDIRDFLQPGVPPALKLAALRRAWSADPAIRDYVGPNENFWEGVGQGGVPGFGELDPNLDVKKLVAEIFGEAEQEPRKAAELVPPTEQSTRADLSRPVAPAPSESAQNEPQPSAAQDATPLPQRDENIALHHDDPQQEAAAARPRRHGGAMPE